MQLCTTFLIKLFLKLFETAESTLLFLPSM